MDGKRFLSSVRFANLLSFGPEGMELELQPLNVLIGPNGSGKSNFIDGMRILQAIPLDLTVPFSHGDTVAEWLWKGPANRTNAAPDFISVGLQFFTPGNGFLSYWASIFTDRLRPRLMAEGVKGLTINGEQDVSILHDEPNSVSGFVESAKTVGIMDDPGYRIRKDPEISKLFGELRRLRIYSDFEVGRYTKSRMPQSASADPFELSEGFGNIALIVNDLLSKPDIKATFLEKLRLFYDKVVDVSTRIAFGTVQLYFQERGLSETVPATRLSDGTMRYLSLLAILLHPSPPPLICIEEPELGMHPDILPTIAELLIDASQRTQLIVTTHSDILLSAIGRTCPEAVVVCEKGPNGTRMTRPDPEQLSKWLEDHEGLGDVWLSGLIGGTRW